MLKLEDDGYCDTFNETSVCGTFVKNSVYLSAAICELL